MPKTRFQMTVRLPTEVRDALDRRVEELRGQGAPVERASLAAHLLSTAVGGGSGVGVESALRVAAQIADVVTLLRREAAPVKADRIEKIARELEGVYARLCAALRQEDDDG